MSMDWPRWTLVLATLSSMLSLSAQAYGQAMSAPLRSDGFALELQGLQSHDTSLEDVGDWFAESKYNEQGVALRWEFDNQWFVEGRVSRGRHLRYLLEVEEDEEGNTQLEDAHGRTRSASLGVGKRIWVNQYFSVMPGVSYMWRQRDTPELYSDFNQQRIAAEGVQDRNVGASIAAEYRVTRRVAVSLNFAMLSSGERQQGIGIAYYFY